MTSGSHGANTHLPPVSYEALKANNRHTHANLDFCIEERERLRAAIADALDVLHDPAQTWLPAAEILSVALTERAQT